MVCEGQVMRLFVFTFLVACWRPVAFCVVYAPVVVYSCG